MTKALLIEFGDGKPMKKFALHPLDVHYAIRRLDISDPYDLTGRAQDAFM
jgi:hypothetical protein